MSNKLQKKFNRSELKSGKFSNAEEASEFIRQIKTMRKSEDLPPPLPPDALVSDFDLLLTEISRSMHVSFSAVRFEDDQDLLVESSLTIELLHSLTHILSLHNTNGLFAGEENIFYCDIALKDVFVYISLEINSISSGIEVQEYVQSVLDKINIQLRPYGSSCKIQLSEDLIRNKRNLNSIFYLNRLENFSSKEKKETLETRRLSEGVLNA